MVWFDSGYSWWPGAKWHQGIVCCNDVYLITNTFILGLTKVIVINVIAILQCHGWLSGSHYVFHMYGESIRRSFMVWYQDFPIWLRCWYPGNQWVKPAFTTLRHFTVHPTNYAHGSCFIMFCYIRFYFLTSGKIVRLLQCQRRNPKDLDWWLTARLQ